MIESLVIKGFQIHRNLSIQLDHPVTTIIGPSDIGKSAILRSLTWVLYNRPLGTAFIHDEEERALVRLEVNGRRITRYRSRKGGNYYKVDGDKFQAFGATVPDEIQRVLRVGDLNYQRQGEQYGFWFGLSPGEASKKLNQIVDLGVIDTTLKHLAGVGRKTAIEEGVISKRLEAAKKERDALRVYEEIDEALAQVEELERDLKTTRTGRAFLGAHLQAIEGDKARRAELLAVVEAFSTIDAIDSERCRLRIRIARLEELVESIEEGRETLQRDLPDLEPLVQMERDRTKLSSRIQDLSETLDEIEFERTRAGEIRREANRTHQRLTKAIGEECPLCGSPLSE